MARYRLRYRSTDLQIADELVIGRSSDCHLTVDDDGVSRRHAVIRITDDGAVVEDLQSRNGTTVNGRRIDGPHTLSHLDRIGIGGQELMLLESTRASMEGRGAVTMATAANQPGLGEGFALVGDVARKSLAMGDHQRAEQVIGKHLEGILRAAREGAKVPDDNFEQAVGLALELAEHRGARWIDWIFAVHGATRTLMTSEVIDRLHELVRRHKGASLRELRDYLASFRDRADSLAHAERFRLRRLESLERVLGS